MRLSKEPLPPTSGLRSFAPRRNQPEQRTFSPRAQRHGTVPAQWTLSAPGDAHEQEAERAADQVMRMAAPGPIAPSSADSVAHGPGQPLDMPTRAFIETRFGHDFSHVRVHSGREAAEAAGRMSARAYTVGGHIVFGDGEYAPASAEGRRLLAHELTHVVQQDGGRTPPGLVSRQPAKNVADQKKAAVAHHEKQQRLVAGFLQNALKIKPDPKNPLQGDNLYRNTAEMVRDGKIVLCILSPTHDSTTRRTGFHAYFDWRVKHPKIGGDYSIDPKINHGVVFENPNTAGRMKSVPTMPTFVPTTKPGTPPPPPPLPVWSPGDVNIYTMDLDITEPELKNTLVHEGQHVADLHDLRVQELAGKDWQRSFEVYKTEFRAFWIQPPLPPPKSGLAQQAIDRLPKETEKPDNTQVVDCAACPASSADTSGKSAPKQVKTGMKNKRQEAIFWHLLVNYPTNELSCLYACNPDFRNAVNAFERPESLNLVNSPRLLELNLALRNLKPAMTPEEVSKTGFGLAVYRLDAVDWAFLGDRKLSKPFWDALKTNAPASLYQAMDSSARKGGPDSRALNKALGVNPNPPHRPVQTTPP
jgi:Domain of unknown function (DUF4157)